jgi:hypothetical protein
MSSVAFGSAGSHELQNPSCLCTQAEGYSPGASDSGESKQSTVLYTGDGNPRTLDAVPAGLCCF